MTDFGAEPWIDRALRLLPVIVLRDQEVTSEQIRALMLTVGLDPPPHPNAWGALTSAAVRRGLLVDTGRVASMVARRSHGRRTPIWRRTW